MKQEILEFIEKNKIATFNQLENEEAGGVAGFKGDKTLIDNCGSILWDKMSESAIDAINSILDDNLCGSRMCEKNIYVMLGNCRVINDDEWLPIIFVHGKPEVPVESSDRIPF